MLQMKRWKFILLLVGVFVFGMVLMSGGPDKQAGPTTGGSVPSDLVAELIMADADIHFIVADLFGKVKDILYAFSRSDVEQMGEILRKVETLNFRLNPALSKAENAVMKIEPYLKK